MKNNLVLSGRIVRGVKRGTHFTQLDWVQKQFMEKLGFRPYPGTLNLEVSTEYIPVIEEMQKHEGVELVSPDPAFCSGKALPANVEGVSGAIIVPAEEVRVHGKNIVEVIAPLRLKDVLDVGDGDSVTLTVDFNQSRNMSKKLNVDAVIFDLDGTLIDSTEIYFRIIEIVFDRLGIPQASRKTILAAVEDGSFNWDHVLPGEMKDRKEEVISEALIIRDEFYLQKFKKEVKLIQGADEILKEISSSDMKMGLVTSTPRQDLVYKLYPLRKAGIEKLFEVIITTDDVQKRKPAADPLLAGGEKLGVATNKCVYVGDTCADIIAGKAAGMKTIGVLTGFDDHELLKRENPEAIINSVNELREAVIF